VSLTTRAVTRTRTVPFTPYPGAPTELVPETYTIDVPRDWDRAVLTAVATGTALLLALAVTWSTASIGAILALTGVITAIAYGVAAVFDLAWIMCMALEWLARYNPAKAQAPRRAGYAALAVSMAAIAAHGIATGGLTNIAAGLVGSAVSLIAKGVWSLAIRHTAKPLSPVAQQWVTRRQAAAGAELAMAVIDRQLERSRAHLTAYRDAFGTLGQPTPDPDKPSGRPDTVSATVRSAVRAALDTMPDASPEEIVEQLARIGIDTDADTVRTLAGQPDGQQNSTSGAVLQLAPHPLGESIADTVRRAVRDGVRDTDDVLIAVRRVHGPAVSRDTVAKTLRRVG
jgi:hypothetical protein